MANELYNDGKYIFINSAYAEAYIPEEIFDRPTDDPSKSSIAYNTGDSIVTLGIFYMRFFDTDVNPSKLRDKTKVRTLVYPNMIECYPSGSSTIEVLTINDIEDKYRVIGFNKGDILMNAAVKKSVDNVNKYMKMIMAGKLPSSLTYDDLYFTWKDNFDSNGVNKAIPAVLMQAVLSKMCRVKGNTETEFRKVAGAGSVDPYSYQMLSTNQVSAYSSVMSSLSFERFSEKLTTSLIMSKTGAEQEKSPIEQIITM